MSHQAPHTRATIKTALLAHDVEPSRGMGQNFLTDVEVARWITEQLDITPEDTVLEIGPGLGALTQHLLGKGKRLILLEKDARLAARLRAELRDYRVEIIEGDALRFDLRTLFKDQPIKLIGALPYSCGTEIVRVFMENPSPISRAVFVMQKEVVDRICAPPSTPDRGLLSLRVQARWVTQHLRVLPPDIFEPQPKVHSAVMALTPRRRAELPTFDERVFDRIMRMGFNQRRKMLRKTLPAHALGWPHLAQEIGALETARAEELTLSQWVRLARLYDPHELKDVPQRAEEIFDVVDAEDRVLRQETRAVVHAQGLGHRAIHIFVFNQRGELLLQKRSHLKDAMPERWDSSAAGHVDAGEEYLPAAVRELAEELGLEQTAEQLTEVAKIPPCAGTGFEWVQLYRTTDDRSVSFPSSEIESVAWFPLAEISAWVQARPQDFADGFLECWARC